MRTVHGAINTPTPAANSGSRLSIPIRERGVIRATRPSTLAVRNKTARMSGRSLPYHPANELVNLAKAATNAATESSAAQILWVSSVAKNRNPTSVHKPAMSAKSMLTAAAGFSAPAAPVKSRDQAEGRLKRLFQPVPELALRRCFGCTNCALRKFATV
jgi:hypothetical protein